MIRFLTVVAAAAFAGMLSASAAAAKPVEKVTMTVKYTSINKKKNTGTASLRTAFTITTDDGAPPPPLNRIQLRFPKGAVTNARPFPTCTVQKILDTAGRGCKSKSIIGRGTAGATAPPIVANVNAKVTLFNGKRSGSSPSIVIFAIPELGPNLALSGTLKKGGRGSRYGYVLDSKIPPIQTLPGAPNASVTRFDATVGAKLLKKKRKKIGYITAPLICSGTFFLLDGTFSYENGITNTVYEEFTLKGGPRCP